ncbi:MAG: cytochrome c oxidase assembly protein [Woeseiaceae bacterium]
MNSQNASLAARLVFFAVAMFGFGLLVLPPLYEVFCEITGFGGRTNTTAQVANEAPDLTRTVRIEFVTTVNNYAPWKFEPTVDSMTVNPGRMYYATFDATNLSGDERVGQAVPSVAPVSATEHFQKIECFCFSSQEFAAGEQRALPLQFIVNPDLPDYVDTITLSYTYFESTYVTRR